MPSGPTTPPAARAGRCVLGGSFNPPTTAHVTLARTALAQLPIDEVLVIPAADHPHKRNRDMAPATDRLRMCELAFAGMPGVQVDGRELRRTGPSFTVDTLAELQAEAPDRPLYFLIGSDNLPLLPTWREPERLLALATVVTYPRPGYPLGDATFARLPVAAAVRAQLRRHVLTAPALDVAATDLRARWRAGERDLVELPPTVRDYLAEHALYR